MTGQAKVGRALLVFSWLGGVLVVNGCGTNFTCEDSKTCSPGGAPGSGTGGSAGGKQGGTGGAESGKGGSAGSAGTSGDTGGEAGDGASGSDAGASTTGGSSNAGGDSGRGGSSGTSGDSGSGGDDDPGVVCGDGKVEGDEECDDGEDNGLGLLQCAPDCSRVIEVKHIVIGEPMEDEYFQPDPIAEVDATCPTGYKALFSYGTDRRATTVPFKTVNSIDWALKPYTYYVNAYENLVWMTREVALLGVENGAFVGLENAITNTSYVFVANIGIDGTNLTSKNCNGWSSINIGAAKLVGLGLATDQEYLAYTEIECGHQVLVYCVEQ